jgi:hypothetical protein
LAGVGRYRTGQLAGSVDPFRPREDGGSTSDDKQETERADVPCEMFSGPARIMTAVGDSKTNRWHLQIANRWVIQYNFYIDDRRWGRMFVRICPYLPFSARVCLNQHHWLASRMREEGIDFKQCGNAFTRCSAPERLQ